MKKCPADCTCLPECTCPHVKAGFIVSYSIAWNELCPEHGVGTASFQALKQMPFGYAGERNTTREEWLAFCKGEASEDES